jgi:TPR repeat protein
MYANGEGVPQDYAEAVKWYRKAAEQGNAENHCRQTLYGQILHQNKVTEPSPER